MNVELEVEAREDVPPWLAYATPVFTVVAALAVSAVALVVLDVNPLAAYETMFVDTVTQGFGQTETLIKAVPLILTGLAVYLPLRAGLWNIGAEGQLILGALAGTWVAVNVSQPAYVLLPLMFLAAAVAGAFWAGVPAWLRAKWDINEIITTLLLTFVALSLKNYLLRGPMQGGLGNFPQSERFSTAATVPSLLELVPGLSTLLDLLPLWGDTLAGIFGSVHSGLLLAVAMVGVVYLVMTQTRFGFEITFVGANHEAAEQAGMSRYKVYLLVFLIGGALAGFAGIAEMSGVQGRFRAGYAPGYGFTAIVVALLGRNSAVKVLGAAVFFAVLTVGGTSMEVAHQVPAALTEVIQALIILFLITAEFVKNYHVGLNVRRKPGSVGATPTEGDV